MANLQPHIRCGTADAAAYAILAGDPARLDRIAEHLQDVREIAYNREHRSLTGTYKGTKVMAVSTGMGGASTGIVVEELAAIGVKSLIRVGSCGALQTSIPMGGLVIANGAVRDDGASKAYVKSIYPAIPNTLLLVNMLNAAEGLGFPYSLGIVRSHDSFYIDNEDEVAREWSGKGVLGADMETAALFIIGGLRGLRTASVLNNVVLYNQDVKDGVNGLVDLEASAAAGEKHSILLVLETIALEQELLELL